MPYVLEQFELRLLIEQGGIEPLLDVRYQMSVVDF